MKYNQWKKLVEMLQWSKQNMDEIHLYLFLQNFLTFKDSPRQPYIRDFAFFCVWTNETSASASSQFAQLFSIPKTLQRSGT